MIGTLAEFSACLADAQARRADMIRCELSPALSEITEAFEKNEPVLYYAELCGMSEVNFRRLFKEYTGKSPIDYRNDLRLLNAKNKLMSGEYNVSEAAEECGFSNLSFFIRLYKKKYGYTPKKE